MNAFTQTDALDGVSFEEVSEGRWQVTVDGERSAQITRNSSGFIAWIGHQDRHWCFNRALKAVAAHARYHHSVVEASRRAHDEAVASLMRMTPAQKAAAVSRLEDEKALLDYAGAHIDVIDRKADLDRRIASLKGAA